MSFLQRFSVLLAALPALAAVDGAVRIVAKTTDANNFEWTRAWYAPGQVPADQWTRPFIDGTGATTWRAHNLTFYSSQWCTQHATSEGMTGATATAFIARCSGSVQSAIVNWVYSTTADQTYTITFRNSSTPCSGSSTDADCTTTGYDLTEALAHNSSNWDFVMKYAAAGGVTHSQSVRQMLTDGNACILYAGPAMTLIYAGWGSGSGPNCTATTTRPYAFGIHRKKVMQSTGTILSTDTTIAIHENPWIAGASFPATAVIRGSVGASTTVTINSATSTQLTLSAAVGTTHAQASIYVVDGAVTNTDTPSHSSTAMNVTSAAGFTAGDIACARDTCFRIHSIASNTLTIGTTTLGAHATGWGWYGIMGRAKDQLAAGMPVVKYADIEYYKATADAQKNLSPAAYLLFVHSRSGVGAQLLTESVWEDRRSGAHFDHTIEIGVGGGTVIATENKVTLSTFSKVMYPDGPEQGKTGTYTSRGFAWSASTPGDAIVDYNLPWMRAVGALPLDPSTLADATALDFHLNTDQLMGDGQPLPGWDNSSKCDISRSYWGPSRAKVEFDGKWYLNEGQGGSSDNIGEMSSHQALALLLMNKTGVASYERWRELIFGSAACGFHQNVHAKSGSTSGTLCGSSNNGTAQEPGASCTGGNASLTPFGRPMLPDHAPSSFGRTFADDVSPRVGQMINLYDYKVSFGSSHYYNMCDVAYTLTGLPAWRDCFEGNVFGALNLTFAHDRPFNTGLTTQVDRSFIGWSEKGIATPSSGPRGRARAVMMLGSGCAKLPEGSALKQVACSKYKNNIAFWEGRAGFTGGNFYNSNTASYDASLWRGGWWSGGASATNDGIPQINTPVETCSTNFVGEVNEARAWARQGMFQFAYYPQTLRFHDLLGLYHGYPLMKHYLRTPVNLLLNPAAHNGTGIRIMGAYAWPTQDSKQPQGSDADCTGQPNPNTLGVSVQFVGSTKWLDYMGAMKSTESAPTATREYPDLVRDRDWLWLAAMGADDTTDGYSIRRAWQSLRSDLKLSSAAKNATQYGQMPNMLWSPDWKHLPKKIAVTPGTTTATVAFVAPENATICGYTISASAITDPSDSGDTTASIGRREHNFSLTSLTTATTYHLRLTCKDASETFVGRRHLTFVTN